MTRQPRLGFLVADGGRARLLVRHGDGRYEELEAFVPADEAHTPRRDGRTRVFASVGRTRSAVDSRASAERSRERFAAHLAEALDRALAADRFDGFVIAAPPKMMHAIEEGLACSTRSRLRRRLARDLTKLPELELRQRLDALSLYREMAPLSA